MSSHLSVTTKLLGCTIFEGVGIFKFKTLLGKIGKEFLLRII